MKIRNSRIRRDMKRLLALCAESNFDNNDKYAEVENIAKRYDMYFDDNGQVKEK